MADPEVAAVYRSAMAQLGLSELAEFLDTHAGASDVKEKRAAWARYSSAHRFKLFDQVLQACNRLTVQQEAMIAYIAELEEENTTLRTLHGLE